MDAKWWPWNWEGSNACDIFYRIFVGWINYDDMDSSKEIKSLYARGNLIIHKFKMCEDDVTSELFRIFCSSFYCCQLWCQYKKKICAAHNNMFRLLFNVNSCNSFIAVFYVVKEHFWTLLWESWWLILKINCYPLSKWWKLPAFIRIL